MIYKMFYSALTLKLANPFGLLRGYRSSLFFLALKLLIIFFLLCSFCRILINHLHRTHTCKSNLATDFSMHNCTKACTCAVLYPVTWCQNQSMGCSGKVWSGLLIPWTWFSNIYYVYKGVHIKFSNFDEGAFSISELDISKQLLLLPLLFFLSHR